MSESTPNSTPPAIQPPSRPSGRTAAGILATFCLLLFIAIGADVLRHGRLYRLDGPIARYLDVRMSHASGAAVNICSGMTSLGSLPFSLATGMICGLWLAVTARWRLLALWIVGLAGSAELDVIMKNRFAQERPLLALLPVGDGYSFPSGHTMAAVMTFGLLAYLLTRAVPRLRVLWMLIAAATILAVAESLMLLGVHYLTDELGALSLACGWLFLVIALLGPPPRSQVI